MNYLFLLLLATILGGLSGCAFDTVMPEHDLWQMRETGSKPITPGEKMAGEVAGDGHKPVAGSNAKAYYDGEARNCAIVTVEEMSADDPGIIKKTRYLIRDSLIQGESYPNYIRVVNPTREGYAREVAIKARNGDNPLLPLIYEGKYFYRPVFIGECLVKVHEYDTEQQLRETYHFELCDN